MNRSRAPERAGVLVLGMHRSGTSAIARVCNLLGASIGSRLIAGDEGINDGGYWEDAEVVALHDRFLQWHERSWHDLRELPEHCFGDALAGQTVIAIREKIRREFGEDPFWLVKDPRLSRLAPLWLAAMEGEKIRPAFVLAIRHPAEVVASLQRRDGMPRSQAIVLWSRYVVESVRLSSGYPRAVSDYGDLLADWRSQLRRVGVELGLQWPSFEAEHAAEIDQFLSDGQRRHRVSDDGPNTDGAVWSGALALYEALLSVSKGIGDWAMAERCAAHLAESLSDLAPMLAEVLDYSWMHAERADRALRVLDGERKALREFGGMPAVRARISALEDELADLMRQRDQASEWAKQVESQRLTLVIERDAAVHERDAAVHERDTASSSLVQLEQEQRTLREWVRASEVAQQHLRNQLTLVESSRSWRLTKPLRDVSALKQRIVGRGGRVRGVLARIAERIYRTLPVSGRMKRKIKSALFRVSGPLLRNTAAYRRWQASERVHAADLSEQYPSSTSLSSPQILAHDDGLRPADGIWEWRDYHQVRERIDAELLRLQEERSVKPRALLDFAGQNLQRVADSIELPLCDSAPLVTILVPAYNHVLRTLECLASIAAATGPDTPSFEVVVADDASTDETPALLGRIVNLRLLSQQTNLGFLRNCNAAAAVAKGRYLLFLNNDVQVCKGWLEALVDCIQSDSGIGAVGPRIVYPSGWLQEAGTALRRDGSSEMIGLNDLPRAPRYAYSRDVDYCSGACLLLRRDDFEALNGFDEAFAPAYCEDSDLCMRLRASGKRIVYCADAEVVHHLSATSDQLPDNFKLECIARNLNTFTSRWQADLDRMDDVRTIAFYLPQFHPIPENDLWWGRGFTEWTNVSKARPNFVGHYQPRLPADLGFYDLRLPEVMEKQAALARRYGISGFCYYYYWFAGKRLLEQPIESMLSSGKPEMPFCLCWANENWTRRWDGEEHDVLMGQQHSEVDDEAVIRDLIRYFRSPSYIRINGRPLLVVYRVGLFPDFRKTALRWREICRQEGVGEIYLAQVESFEMVSAGIRPDQMGCDAAVEFPPHGMAEPYPVTAPLLNPDFNGAVADYRDLAVRYSVRNLPSYKRFLGVATGWDNTARRQNNSYCFEHATPGVFQAWMEEAIARTKQQFAGEERLVFINAWNEWAEGAYLEPDRRYGHAFLQAAANAREASHLLRQRHYSLG